MMLYSSLNRVVYFANANCCDNYDAAMTNDDKRDSQRLRKHCSFLIQISPHMGPP